MNIKNETTAKVLVGLILTGLLTAIVFVLASLIFYEETHEICLENCREKYRFNIDDSWEACEDRCNIKYDKVPE